MSISKQLEEGINKELGHLVGKFTHELTLELVEATPVDTGFARSNWIPTTGAPFPDIVGSREAVDTSVQQSALAALGGYQLKDGDLYIANNTPYIGDLNAGSSPEASSGFVEAAVDEAVTRVAE